MHKHFNFELTCDVLQRPEKLKTKKPKHKKKEIGSSDEDDIENLLLERHETEAIEEEKDDFYLIMCLDMYKLFKRIKQLTGITFSKQSKRELKNNSHAFKLVVPDIVKMSAKVLCIVLQDANLKLMTSLFLSFQVKHMNIVSLAEGNWLWIETKNSETREAGDRLFRLAMSKFEASIRSTPDNRYDSLLNDLV